MPRPPRPYVYRNFYCTNYGGIPHQKLCRLAEGPKAAAIALARLVVKKDDNKQERMHMATLGARMPEEIETNRMVQDVFNEYLALKEVETDRTSYEYYCSKLTPLLERLGTRPIRSITLLDGLEFKNWLMHERVWIKGKKLMTGLGNCTVNHHIRVAKGMFSWAAKASRRYILANPWDEIVYLPEKSRERIITDEEFVHLLSQASTGNLKGADVDMREMLLLLRNTTLRPGELRALRWEYIHFDRHVLIFPADTVKTRVRRQVTINEVCETLLRDRAARLFPGRVRLSGYVFPGGDRTDSEKQIDRRSLVCRFRRLIQRCVRLGLITDLVSGERLVNYSTRHTRITEMVASRLPLAVVMDDAGHTQASTTQRYTHIADAMTTNMVREIPGINPVLPASSPSAKAGHDG